MKKLTHFVSLIFVLLIIYWGFQSQMPNFDPSQKLSENNFSTQKALAHIANISKDRHAVGQEGHKKVRSYLLQELSKLGLQPEIKEGFSGAHRGNISKCYNILAKIKGTDTNAKSLLLLSHYDSALHSSLGASDAGSGVATILEGVRAFLSENKTPKNDIILLFSDAEELGLVGAELFVNQHPWAKNIGLTINFEARGSGGPGYMLIETNGGNKKLIEHFKKANPQYPVSNSLMYSIYKMLPNDTDLTVFREDGDIEGFNFAFIDDHYDYHTSLDNYERLDRNTLEHQGQNLMPLLHYFAETDLSDLKHQDDEVYFDIPIFTFVSYPFQWIWILYGIALLLFIYLVYYGTKVTKQLDFKSILHSFVPFLLSLIVCGILGYFSWPLLRYFYPEYKDILQGFTYNGHQYIWATVFFSLSILFLTYSKFKQHTTANLLIAPLFIWFLICGAINIYLKGASFLIVPLLFSILMLWLMLRQKQPSIFLMVILGMPALFIYPPFIKMFPIGLGLKMMISSALLIVLVFGLLIPIFNRYRSKKIISLVLGIFGIVTLIKAHLSATFTAQSPKPSSLVYFQDQDALTSFWCSYDNVLSSWNSLYINKEHNNTLQSNTLASKYNSGFKHSSNAPHKDISSAQISVLKDSIIQGNRTIEFCISLTRQTNRLDVYMENKNKLTNLVVNGVSFKDRQLKNKKGKLFSHFISDQNDTQVSLSIPAKEKVQLVFYESSNDLLNHSDFTVPERPVEEIAMPFVINDAIIIKKTHDFN